MKNPYGVLAVILTALMVSETATQTVDGSWIADFWEYSAAVRELARHPLHPAHPLFALDAPHQFYSPYTLVLGLVSRATGLSSVSVLAVAGIVNLVLLLVVLPSFMRIFTRERHAAFFLLLFTLLLWGRVPWPFSGFLHLDVIGFVLPYASTFATALALSMAVVWVRFLETFRPKYLLVVAIGAGVVLCTHPVPALFLFVLLVTLGWERVDPGHRTRVAFGFLLVLGTSAGVAALWPYYPFFSALAKQHTFDPYYRPYYEAVLSRTFPLLIAIPVLWRRWQRSSRDSLAPTFLALAAVYAFGYFSSRWSLGRVLPFAVLTLDLALADSVAGWTRRGRVRARAVVVVTALAVCAATFMSVQGPIARALPRIVAPSLTDRYRSPGIGADYRRLFAGVSPDSVTMANPSDGWPVPSYGGKIVAAELAQPFVPDVSRRLQAVRTFFSPATSTTMRRKVLCRYHARYVLFAGTEVSRSEATTLERLGAVFRTSGIWVLVNAKPCTTFR